ncbi:MAG: undecaprenyl-diphosphate phosphatase, partial [Parcubacteria group bacterium]
MTVFQSIILGIVQGLGEFLPISSTAHLAIIPYFFNWKDPGLGFDVALHVGTLIALILFFWKDWKQIIFNFQFSIFNKFSKSKFPNKKNLPDANSYLQNTNLLWLIIIATIPGVIFGVLFESKAETVFRSPLLIAFTLAVMGLILFLVDKYAGKIKDINKVTIKDSILIGISQAIAIIPGVSRSGATITAGRACGMNRKDAARFSFLLSA